MNGMGALYSFLSRPKQYYNISERALKFINKSDVKYHISPHFKDPQYSHEQDEKIIDDIKSKHQNVVDAVNTIEIKDTPFFDKNKTKEIASQSIKRLPQKYGESVMSQYGYTEPKYVTPGNLTITQLLKVLTTYSEYNRAKKDIMSNIHISENVKYIFEGDDYFFKYLARKYDLEIEILKEILDYYKLYEFIMPNDPNKKASQSKFLNKLNSLAISAINVKGKENAIIDDLPKNEFLDIISDNVKEFLSDYNVKIPKIPEGNNK